MTYSCTKRGIEFFSLKYQHSLVICTAGHLLYLPSLAIRCCHFQNWLLCLGIRDGGLPCVGGINEWGEGGEEHVIHCSLTPPLPLSSFWLPEELAINFNHSASRIRLDDVANTSSACALAIGWGRMLLDEIFHQEELATASWQVGYRENAKCFYKCLAGNSDLIYNCLLILYEFVYWL